MVGKGEGSSRSEVLEGRKARERERESEGLEFDELQWK